MRINRLSVGASYDMPDVLIHMTRRTSTPNRRLAPGIAQMDALARLQSILATRSFRAAPPFDNDWPVVCFSQMTQRALSGLMISQYEPVGIAVHKQDVFDQGGAPALYVRGDEYKRFRDSLPPILAARAVRYWPGSEPETPVEGFFEKPQGKSEWIHEREWRLPAPEPGEWAWHFPPSAIAFVILDPVSKAKFEWWRYLQRDAWMSSLRIATWNPETNSFSYRWTDWP